MNLYHKMGCVDPEMVAQAAMSCLDSLQTYQQAPQIMGACAIFLRICKRFDLEPAEALRYTNNLLASEAAHRPQFRAIDEYLRKEFKS